MPTHEAYADADADEQPGAAWLTPTVALVTAVLLYGLVVGVQALTPPRSHIASVLVAVPAVIALAFGPPVIVVSAVVAAGTRWVFFAFEPVRIGSAVGTTAAIVAIAAVGCFVVVRRRRETAQLVKVTSVAEAAQRAVLRPPPAVVGPYRIAAGYRAAAEFARIGGDLYAVVDTSFGLRALIGDVRGKGLEAVAMTAAVLGSFREAAYERPTLDALATQLDVSLRRSHIDEEAFATALLIELDADGGVRALSCGHPTPLVLRGGSVIDLPAPPGLPLGLRGLVGGVGVGVGVGVGEEDGGVRGEDAGDADDATTAQAQLTAGDVIVMFTDGITEARDASGRFYPLARRLTDRVQATPWPVDLGALIDWLQRDAAAYGGGVRHDDAALLALAWRPEPEQPWGSSTVRTG